MKKKSLILLIAFFLMGSQVISSQSKTGNLPVIDISKEYPKKQQRLQEIADLEYIPLETTDKVLLSDQDRLSYVSDNYILVHSPVRGDIFVFNRKGKIVFHFNHRGQSGWEYPGISKRAGVTLDEKNEEIFVCSNSIQVYSLRGEYKRTLKINTIQYHSKVFNFDNEMLLVYDDVFVEEPNINVKGISKTNPYYFISKKDGSVISELDIHLPKRYSTRFVQMSGNNMYRVDETGFPHSMYYGQDFVISDISSDTLYLLTQNKALTPLLSRKPSVHASEPKIIWFTLLTTDKFILIGKFPLSTNSSSRGGSGRIPVLMYEFKTGEISEISFLDLDAELLRRRWGPGWSPATAKNMTAELIWPSSLIDAYRTKQLKGDVAKLAMTLDEDDNPIVRIIKFK